MQRSSGLVLLHLCLGIFFVLFVLFRKGANADVENASCTSVTTHAVLDVTPDDCTESFDGNTGAAKTSLTTATGKRAGALAKKEGSADWNATETETLLAYLEENYKHWSTGKKVTFYKKMVSSGQLPGRDVEQIKNKLGKLRKKYLEEKAKVNGTGAEPSKWSWYEKMDNIFGHRENVTPSCLISTKPMKPVESDDETEVKEEVEEIHQRKRRKVNAATMLTDAITNLGETKNQIWDKRLALQEKERIDNAEIEKGKTEVEKLKAEYEFQLKKDELEIERIKAQNEQKRLELELEKLRCSSFMSDN